MIKLSKEDKIENAFAVLDKYKTYTIEELQELVNDDRLNYSVMALNITGDLNIGNMIRSAQAFGASRFFIFGRRKVDNRSMCGADKYIPIIKVNGVFNNINHFDENTQFDIDAFKQTLNQYNLIPVFCDTGEDYKLYDTIPWQHLSYKALEKGKQLCFIFGNEGFGIPNYIIRSVVNSDCMKITIKQRGVMRSINVASSMAVICSHYASLIGGE